MNDFLLNGKILSRQDMDVTEDSYGQSWKNGPFFYLYYDHISDSV